MTPSQHPASRPSRWPRVAPGVVPAVAPGVVPAVDIDPRLDWTLEAGVALRARLAVAMERGEVELPVLPEMAAEVLALCADERCDARRLADSVRRDPALVANILRVANSPACGAAVAIKSLPQAVSRLGIGQVRGIALAVACRHRVFAARGFETEVRALFRHSFAAALWAQEIARARRWNVEEAFLAGLLHDVGRPAVLQAAVTLEPGARTGPLRAQALALADEHHATVGEALALRWRLPTALADVIAGHHGDASRAGGTGAAVTRFADDLARLTTGEDGMDEDTLRAHPMLVPLNLYGDEVDGLLARREALTQMLEAMGA